MMGQVHTSNKFLPENHLYDDLPAHNNYPHGKTRTEVTVSSPHKRKIEQVEQSMEMDSKRRRIFNPSGDRHLEISRGDVGELVSKLLFLLAPEQPLSEKPKRENEILPKLEENHFRFGEDPADREFVIYMRLDGFGDLWKVLLEHYKSGGKFEISVILRCHEKEFFEQRIPFKPSPNIDIKFHVRCNKRNVAAFLKNLSSRIQLLVSEEEMSEISKPVLESEEISYGSLVHTVASLSLCKITNVKGHPESVHDVSCYIFLDVPLLFPKNSPSFCRRCTEGSHLMTVFHEVKLSSGKIIDLSSPQVAVAPMELGPFDTNSLIDDDEYIEPTDLSVNKTAGLATETVENLSENPRPIVTLVTKQSEAMIYKSVNTSESRTPENPLKKIVPKAEQKIRKVMTVKPIERKHKGRSRQLFLQNKMKEMQKRFLALKKQQVLHVDKLQIPTGPSGTVVETEVPSSVIPQPSPPATVTLVPITVVPAVPPTVAPASPSSMEKKYKCPEKGCTESFNSKSPLSRHRMKVHFANKIHTCDNCGHAFPRPYMLTRHVRDKLCLPRDRSISTPTMLVAS